MPNPLKLAVEAVAEALSAASSRAAREASAAVGETFNSKAMTEVLGQHPETLAKTAAAGSDVPFNSLGPQDQMLSALSAAQRLKGEWKQSPLQRVVERRAGDLKLPADQLLPSLLSAKWERDPARTSLGTLKEGSNSDDLHFFRATISGVAAKVDVAALDGITSTTKLHLNLSQ